MADKYYSWSDKEVYQGDTAMADDVNDVNTSAYSGFNLVEIDVTSLEQLTDTIVPLSMNWATAGAGTEPDAINYPGSYSSRSNAEEAKDWASASDGSFDPGDTIHLVDGTTTTAPSSKTSADYAKTQADAAEVSATDAAASAAISITNSTMSAGDNISVIKTGSDPYDYEVSSLASNYNLLINTSFNVNQMQYDGVSTLAVGEYGYDMWGANTAGTVYTVTASGEIAITSGSLYQKNDDMIAVNLSLVTLSVSSGSMSASGSGITGTQTITLSTPYTFILNTSSLLVLGATGETFSGIKLELGSTATTHQRSSISDEFSKCCRYFSIFYNGNSYNWSVQSDFPIVASYSELGAWASAHFVLTSSMKNIGELPNSSGAPWTPIKPKLYKSASYFSEVTNWSFRDKKGDTGTKPGVIVRGSSLILHDLFVLSSIAEATFLAVFYSMTVEEESIALAIDDRY